VRSLGIDVGVAKGLDLVLMDERRVPLAVRSHTRPEEVGALIEEFRPDVVAIDSPPRWAATGRSRRTERELAACNIQSFNTPSEVHGRGNAFFAWMEVGFGVFRIAAEHGFPTYGGGSPKRRAMEVFPHATAVVLAGSLPPKGVSKRAWRERVLHAQGVRTDELTSIDRIDAALSALTGLLALDGRRFAPGDPTEGVIMLPVNTLPATPFRRAANAPSAVAPLFNYCACGDPECQALVRGEFAPGHDAKRKAMLWRRAREGRASIDELEERGWKLPPEMR
jgi:predicted nuclease with RNAse H fold